MKNNLDRSCILGIIAFICFGSISHAESNHRLLVKETFMEMESISSPMISPDGTEILFSRRGVDKMNDRSRSNLWISDVAGTRIRELTHGNWSDSSPVWSPDGKKIAFLSDRDGTTQIHVMWMDTREVAQLTHLQRAPSGLRWRKPVLGCSVRARSWLRP